MAVDAAEVVRQRYRLIGIAVLVPIVAGLMIGLYAWPAARSTPHRLPLGISAPGGMGVPLERALAADGRDAFELHRYGSESLARKGIRAREVYGAIVVAPAGVRVLTASAASPTVAELLRRTATRLGSGRGSGQAPTVVDVVPASAKDPTGAVLAATVLPLALAGLLGGLAIWLFSRSGLEPALGTILLAALGGLVAVGVLQGWLGVLGGSWWRNSAAVGATLLAVGAATAGLGALAGRLGVGLAAVVTVLVGVPFAGVGSAPELLPSWAGRLGQYLPPGAGGTLLRDTAFFDGAAAGRALAVLAIWAAGGVVLVLAGSLLPWGRRE